MKAFYYTGYVIKKGEKVTAGFCSDDHSFESQRKSSPDGYMGEWKEVFGLQPDMQ
ncbi:hypothetical protein HMPREF9413_5370 [Paenibacillus sp. HGF7]|nr:hypothetical protein HMPREF9413_5370 [Paenibacillus sp. HGF7]